MRFWCRLLHRRHHYVYAGIITCGLCDDFRGRGIQVDLSSRPLLVGSMA